MTIWHLLLIVGVIILVGGILIANKMYSDGIFVLSLVVGGMLSVIGLMVSIGQPLTIKQELSRQTKERKQILYYIENLDETTDKTKLNEWILNYNDWVNNVNTDKEVYGWFAWYRDVDMTNHTAIDLQ